MLWPILVLNLSLWLMVLSLGAQGSISQAVYLIHRPRLLAPAAFALFVAAPALAIGLSAAFALPAEVKFALIALAVSPVPALLPFKQIKAGVGEAYAVGLLVAAAALSVVVTPLLVLCASRLLGADAHVPAASVARTVAASIGAPLSAGLAVKVVAPRLAARLPSLAVPAGETLQMAGMVLLLITAWPAIAEVVHDGALVSVLVMTAAALGVGHLLGGPENGRRAALALAAATRHPGVAAAIATASFPAHKDDAMAAVLLVMFARPLVITPYLWWMKRRAVAAAPQNASPT